MTSRLHSWAKCKAKGLFPNRKRREEEDDCEKGDQMEVQWAEDEKLEEILERRRREGSSLKADVMQNVPELVVHERVSQGKKSEG